MCDNIYGQTNICYKLQWHAVPSREPGGPPNRRLPWYLCKPHVGAFEIHGATQPGDVAPVWRQLSSECMWSQTAEVFADGWEGPWMINWESRQCVSKDWDIMQSQRNTPRSTGSWTLNTLNMSSSIKLWQSEMSNFHVSSDFNTSTTMKIVIFIVIVLRGSVVT